MLRPERGRVLDAPWQTLRAPASRRVAIGALFRCAIPPVDQANGPGTAKRVPRPRQRALDGHPYRTRPRGCSRPPWIPRPIHERPAIPVIPICERTMHVEEAAGRAPIAPEFRDTSPVRRRVPDRQDEERRVLLAAAARPEVLCEPGRVPRVKKLDGD